MASVNKVILIAQVTALYLEGRSIPQISEATGVAKSTVRAWLLEAGVELRDRTLAMTQAKRSGRGTSSLPGKYQRTPEMRAKLSAAMVARREASARGRSVKPNGYIEVTRGPHKGRGEHRVVMEKALQRKLSRNEVVHHIDHNRANNDPANLAVMTRSEHARMHRLERFYGIG